MSDNFFQTIETASEGESYDLQEAIAGLQFDSRGLLPVITQCAQTGKVLMMAWMNKEALEQTLKTGQMFYFSRKRKQLWQKGETSGNTQKLISLAADCDGDCLLAKIQQKGPPCHTNRATCFYLRLSPEGAKIVSDSTPEDKD